MIGSKPTRPIAQTSLGLGHYTRYKGNAIELVRPKKPRRLIKDVMTESEVSRLLLAARDIRAKAMICLLAYSGVRNQELCNLKLEDVDLGENQITVRDGKIGKMASSIYRLSVLVS